MALGEAHVISMTKAGLEEAGVNIQSLEAAASSSGKELKYLLQRFEVLLGFPCCCNDSLTWSFNLIALQLQACDNTFCES